MSLIDEMARDAGGQFQAPADEQLRSISDLALEQLRLMAEVDAAEARIKELRERLNKVREVDLPNALEALGMSSFAMADGTGISIKEDVFAAITEENRDRAFSWLEEHGHDGIIKNEVKVPFGKGQDPEARRLLDLLNAQGYSYTNLRSVHPSTLKAFVRTQLEDGAPVPTDIFSVHVKKTAVILR